MFVKHVVRYAVLAGLVGGAAALAIGPEGRARVGALWTQTTDSVNQAIDARIGDPVALRAQMKGLEREYPQRIAAVQQDLVELRQQVSQLEREAQVSDRVVALATADYAQLQDLIARGQEAQTSHASFGGGGKIVRVVFNNSSLDLNDAFSKANRIAQIRQAYANRAADIQRDLGYLSQQQNRLETLLNQLQSEYTEFQAQLWQMDRQVETIARNERLIAVMEKRQRTIDEQSRYRSDSLDQLADRFASIRAKQESRLEALGTGASTLNYEDRAKFELDRDAGRRELPGLPALPGPAPRPTVIEIRPEAPGTPNLSASGRI